MSDKQINILIASNKETVAVIEGSLNKHQAGYMLHRIERHEELLNAMAGKQWHIALSELDLADFSALDIAKLIQASDMHLPLVVIKDSGDEAAAIRCMEEGLYHSIQCSAQYLQRLPKFINELMKNAEAENGRRLLEKRLVESEERYLDIFDNTSDLIQCIAPDGRFIYTNRTWRAILGYGENEVNHLNLLDVLHPDSQLCCQDRFKRLLDGETLTKIEFKFVTKAGETIHLAGDCGSIVRDGEVISTRGIFRNITDTVRAETALRASEARYQALYENAPDIYTSINDKGEILSINHAGAKMLGYEVPELIGESAAILIHPEDQQVVFDYVKQAFQDGNLDDGIEYRKIRKDGGVFWVHQRVRLEPDAKEPRLLVVCRDVTEKRNLEEQLAYQATHDTMTNLINRREFERRLQRVLSSDSGVEQHVLCFMDLDKFKIINDTCGHKAGDELLRQVATLLQGQMRSRDTLARLGGDEFGVLMEHCSISQATGFAEKIRATIGNFKFYWRSEHFTLGVSIGLVLLQNGYTITDAIDLADAACYNAKKQGRDCIHVHEYME